MSTAELQRAADRERETFLFFQRIPLSEAKPPYPGRFCCIAGECLRSRLRNPNPMPVFRLFRGPHIGGSNAEPA